MDATAEVDDAVGGAVDAQDGAVDAQVVVVGLAPGAERVEIVVGLAGAVLAAHQGFGLVRVQAFVLHEALDAVLHGRADEHVQAVQVAEDVVGAAAHDDGVALFGDVPDHLALDLEQHVVIDIARLPEAEAAGGEEAGHGEQALALLAALEDALGIAAFLGGLADELVVVDRDAEFLADGLGDVSAAAAELSSYVDDCICHSERSVRI